jgi:tRNA(Glu) U13 pseudouridine synthase TruD
MTEQMMQCSVTEDKSDLVNKDDLSQLTSADLLEFTLVKCMLPTSTALNILAERIGLDNDRDRIRAAGLKDRRAYTAQRVTVSGVDPKTLIALSEKRIYSNNSQKSNKHVPFPAFLKIKDIATAFKPLCNGSLNSNHFKIKVYVPNTSKQELTDYLAPMIKRLEDNGNLMPNWYGRQRLGANQRGLARGMTMLTQGMEVAVYRILCESSELDKPETQRLRNDLKELWELQEVLSRPVAFNCIKERLSVGDISPTLNKLSSSSLPEDKERLEVLVKTGAAFAACNNSNGRSHGAKLYRKLNLEHEYELANFLCKQVTNPPGQNIFDLIAKNRRLKDRVLNIYISSIQSYLFNQVLADKFESGNTNIQSDEEIPLFCFDGNNQKPGRAEKFYKRHFAGRQETVYDQLSTAEKLSRNVVDIFLRPRNKKNKPRLGPSRKLFVEVKDLTWKVEEGFCEFTFRLPPGSYATTFLSLFFAVDQEELATDADTAS